MKQLISVLALIPALAWAQATPTGLWKTIDDKTKTEKALVRVVESNGVFSAKLEKLLAADAKPDAVCDLCTDDRKGKPMVGLEIMRGVKKGHGSIRELIRVRFSRPRAIQECPFPWKSTWFQKQERPDAPFA